MTPCKRRFDIYDQLDPTYVKYHNAIELLGRAGCVDVNMRHRHGYSWCVMGAKPA